MKSSKNNLIIFLLIFTGLLIIFSYGVGNVSAATNNQTVQNLAATHTTTPKVISIDPVKNSVNVPKNKIIKIKFNEPIKSGNKLIYLKNSKGILTSITTSINGNVLTIYHPKPLTSGKFTLTLHNGSITDKKGNKISLWTSTFTVGSSVGYNIRIFDTSLGGNVLANPAVNKIPKTYLSNQIFQLTKQGSVILKFGNGQGPKLLISVGIHGNEPQANIAAMKYLEYIKNKNFKGTIYIIPFDIPKDTALNTRYYNGLDPNRDANIKGTPGWKIVQFAKNNGINYLIDVHSGGGVGKKGFIYHNAASTKSEKKWISYIVSKTGCLSGVDKADNPGMIRYTAHKIGISSITLETERDNISVMVAAEAEYKMILSATKYIGFP
jgi:uncharacterized protein